ncbi:threonine aldolase family protein [Thermobispora bispora]|jgi:threonine aldolase|uniref:Threonine aldolase n=1 Tax=Thermobispora bispora (strain ATCC 19993 / DSM 43833 / CBS 139.67 / JCM 10125 / KCTC 9307 / NBRC 14880 / R51) TaxID=469371 RepID=D6Y8Q8_THEBD|nr:Threonine aldolase [Thermobispora bispora DSM 43833]MBO2474264.1 low specificity L-threonine aldolase [Actinomycetales bacterium]
MTEGGLLVATDAVRRHDPAIKAFASDNYAGVHPEVLEAIALANGGHQVAYGDDVYSAALADLFRRHFGDRAEAFPVFNGTAANVVALRSMCAPWEAVICPETAHINTDEGGAPEVTGGLKLLTVPTEDGKLTPEAIDRYARGLGDVHRAQPRVVSISNATELGTVYTPDELAAICDRAHELGLLVHVDGARLTNAAAALDVPLRAITTDVGVDVVSFGGTKIGLLFGEAVVVLNPAAARGLPYLRKTLMQLPSKMRFVAVQFEALLAGDLWLRNARRANAMARRLADKVRDLPRVTVVRPVEANAVFAVLPRDVADRLRKRYRFYNWSDRQAGTGGEDLVEVRWMCAFDTTEEDVDAFAAALAEELGL